MADEVEPTYCALAIAALPTFGAAWLGNEIVLLIEADGRDLNPGEFGQPADADISHGTKFLLNL